LRDGPHSSQIEITEKKEATLAKYNRDLKEIASLCGLSKFYLVKCGRQVVFANCLKTKRVATEVIGEAH